MVERARLNRTDKHGSSMYSGTPTTHGCVLLYGPPGCGKTYFLKSTSNEFKLATEFISCERLKEDFAEGVKTQAYFKKLFSRARESAPSMVILDNIDKITSKRSLKDIKIRKAVYQLLRELDHIEPGDRILITATSNEPYLIEPLLFKARRFDKLIFVPMPNEDAREALFKLFLKDLPLDDNINTKSLSRITKGFNSSDIKEVVAYADEQAEAEDSVITIKHLEEAIKEFGPSLDHETLEPIKKFFMQYKSGKLGQEEHVAHRADKVKPYKKKERPGRKKHPRKPKEELEFTIEEDSGEVVFETDETELDMEEVEKKSRIEIDDDFKKAFDDFDIDEDEAEEVGTTYRRKWA